MCPFLRKGSCVRWPLFFMKQIRTNSFNLPFSLENYTQIRCLCHCSREPGYHFARRKGDNSYKKV